MSGEKRSGINFKWRIDNFSFCPYESIASPYFADENLCQKLWQLVLYPKCGESSDDFIRCELCKYEEMAEIVIDFKIEIIGPSGHILGVYEEKNAIFHEVNLVKGSSLVKRAHIIRDILETNKDTITVCCHLSSTDSSDVNFLDCVARTKIIVNKESLRLNWAEDNVLRPLLNTENQFIAEAVIYGPDMTAYSIAFNKVKDYVEINIIYTCKSPQCIECKISLLDAQGYQVLSIRDRYLFSDTNDSWTLPPFLPVSELTCNRSKYIKNGNMIILCELFCSGGIESQREFYGSERKLLANYINDTVIIRHTLQSDIRNLFSDEILCDVKLRVNDEILPAHKSILAARSPVFHAMFQQDMLETQTGIVDIRDVDVDTLKEFLNFLYSDTVNKMDYDCAKNLLILAEKYEVLRLKEVCASFLMSGISERNACEVAALADMVTHTDMKCFALDFIADHSNDILTMPAWLQWIKNHMGLATEIFQKLTEKQLQI